MAIYDNYDNLKKTCYKNHIIKPHIGKFLGSHTPVYKALLAMGALLVHTQLLANTVQQATQSLQLPTQTPTQKANINLFDLVKPTKAQPTQSSGQPAGGHRQGVYITGFELQSDVAAATVAEMQGILNSHFPIAPNNKPANTLTYNQLQQKITTLENWLRHEKKLFKASVFMPIQNLSSGRVKLVVKQGSIQNFALGSGFADTHKRANALAILQQHLKPYQALTVPSLEEAAFHVMDYLKAPINLVLKPTTAGLYTVQLEAQPQKKVHGFVGVDNLGSRYTNEVKDTVMLGVNNVTGNQDFLYLSAQLVTPNQKMYKMRYEKPFVNGQSLAMQWQESRYKLCCEFKNLNATGRSQTLGLEYSASLQRTRKRSQSLTSSVQYKKLKNKQNNNNVGNTNIRLVTLKYTHDWSNQVADNRLSVQASLGHTGIKNTAQYSQDQLTTKTQGKFLKTNIDYSTAVPVASKGLLKASLSGQWSNKNLNAAEKKSIGGIDAVRALPYGALSADHAATTQLEYEHQFTRRLSGSVFVDASTFARNANTWQGYDQKNKFAVVGAGAGIQWRITNAIGLQASLATQIGNAYEKHTGDDLGKVNALLQAKWYF